MRSFTFFMFLLVAFVAQAQPKTSAPVPPARKANDVISIYGGTYTNISSVNYNPFWGQSGAVNIAYDLGDGNLAMAYTNFNYQGTGFEANPQNASAMEFIHIDIWTSKATVVKFSPIDNSGVGPGEFLVDVPLKSGEWSSVDLPKSAFTGMSWNSVFQLKFDGQAGVSPSDIYLDNIYFWKKAAAAGTDATLSVLQIDSTNLPGFNPSAYDYNYGVPGGGKVPKITLAKTTDTLASITSITQASGIPGTATVVVTAADKSTKATYTIAFFYNSPAGAAPQPTASNVISLFSEAYTDTKVDTWNTSWSQSVYEEIKIGENATKKYSNLGFNGIETTSTPIDAKNMTHLHLDVWSPNITTLNIKLVSFLGDGFAGANGDSEANLNFNLTAGEWNQLKIPLADFTAGGLKSLEDLNQYILTSTPFGSGTLFLDNMYFSGLSVGVKDLDPSGRKLHVYPNPAIPGSYISVNATLSKMEIYNLAGQKMAATTQSNINLATLPKGVYVVKMISEEGFIYTDKLLVK